ncbi:type VI secretion system baseplate subunit TssG [Methylocaldum sp.]|uniref:type VI secretion system baseplate subunit TssG n=1 Tax=Methylocaldum sp. TaxID=1969727 RepID=UPI002D4D8313|nr:type VI secretion system baseplate subunit TssG [Methylocaldum sp.]HYE34300.1 type VI secretion system baseplate subunit TssG [Methylocaldum sp.]
MAAEDRKTPHDLSQAAREAYEFDFFQLLRLIECRFAAKPRLGTSLTIADEPIRLRQVPELDFAPSALASFTPGGDGRPADLSVRFLGLFGPNGPLPLHLTEYARERLHHHNDSTFARFADVFHHRMLSLFYRSWANVRPSVSFDRPESDSFAFYLECLVGLGLPSLQNRDAMPDRAKRFLSGLLACQTKHADGLSAIIQSFFNTAVSIREFIGEWMDIPEDDRFQLGKSPQIGALGLSAVIGARVWGCQHKFCVVLGPLGFDEYRAFLPGGASLVELVALVRNYIGQELVWSANLILRAEEVPSLMLNGSAQLGWTTWLGDRASEDDADDLLLNPYVRGVGNGQMSAGAAF